MIKMWVEQQRIPLSFLDYKKFGNESIRLPSLMWYYSIRPNDLKIGMDFLNKGFTI